MSKPGRGSDKIKPSKRLEALAGLALPALGQQSIAADIGCDHGLLAAALVQRGLFPRAVASDINPRPLEAAKETFRRRGLSGYIDARLGGGLSALSPGEAEVCVIAGMGGLKIISILEASPEITRGLRQLVLSPERDSEALRRFLHAAGFLIAREALIPENGRFYPALDARPGAEPAYSDIGYAFGARLLEAKDPVLFLFLKKELARAEKLLAAFDGESPPTALSERLCALSGAVDNFE